MAFEYQPPRYIVDTNPLANGFNALSQGVTEFNNGLERSRVREQGRNVSTALAQGDYASAMRATDNPELALGLQRQKIAESQASRDYAMREREFSLRQQEAARQADQWRKSFGLQQQSANREDQKFGVEQSKRVAELYGGVAQLVATEQDDNKARMMWQRIATSHPQMVQQLKAHGIDPSDHRGGAQFLIAQARGYTPQEAGKINIVPEGGTAILTDPRTGQHQVIAQGGPKPLKDHETKDAMWAERLERSNAIISNVAGTDGSGKPSPGMYDPARPGNRFWPDNGVMGMVNSSSWQQYQQAAREGIAAILRKDTGAAVTQSEWDLYFPMLYPQPGDSPAVVAQKAEARKQTAAALKAASGQAYDRMFPAGMPRVAEPQQPSDVSKLSDEELMRRLNGR